MDEPEPIHLFEYEAPRPDTGILQRHIMICGPFAVNGIQSIRNHPGWNIIRDETIMVCDHGRVISAVLRKTGSLVGGFDSKIVIQRTLNNLFEIKDVPFDKIALMIRQADAVEAVTIQPQKILHMLVRELDVLRERVAILEGLQKTE